MDPKVDLQSEPDHQSKLGFWSSTALVVGNIIGSGIFLLPATLAAYGGISLLAWLCSAVGAILMALVFGELGRLAPRTTGGPYAYTKISLGEFPAYLVAWSYWISIWCTNAAIVVALVSYLTVFIPILSKSPLAAIFTGLSVIWLLTWTNSKKIRTVGSVQLITTILKLVPLLLIGGVGIFYMKLDNFPAFNTSGGANLSVLTTTVMLTFFAFLGMESATIPGSKIKDAAVTIRKSTIAGTVVAVFVYLLGSVAVMGLLPGETLAKSNAPFADAAAVFWGASAQYVIAAGAVISTFGALNGWILIQGQIPMSAARDKLFPKVFGRLNRNGSPALGIVISSILASVLLALNYSKTLVDAFTFMITLSTLSVLTPYFFSAASYVLQSAKLREGELGGKLTLASLAFGFSLWVMVGSGQEVVFWGFILLVAGIPFYVWMKMADPGPSGEAAKRSG
ncbi:MAG: amino acid permease [candidate division Zixibacteria bacterium]|nr:amino acid permease [candidate division Zixibacteria bacterium]